MKPRYFECRPRGARSMWYRDVPHGTVVLDRYGFWGVLENGYIDCWDAPPRRFEKKELVLLMDAKPALRKVSRKPRSPSDASGTLSRVAHSPCPKSGQ